MLSAVGRMAEHRISARNPWTNVYGLARTLLALAALLTIALNRTTDLFRPAAGEIDAVQCDGLRQVSVYCLADGHLELARWIAIAALVLVGIGWRPRWTGVIHCWITFSFAASARVLEGGDQVQQNLALLLLPVTLTDSRAWHWQAFAGSASDDQRVIAWVALWLVRLQVSVIYLHAAIGKLAVEDWQSGTAVYYWFVHPVFGAPVWLSRWLMPIVMNGACVALITWGVVVLEIVLGMAIVMSPRGRKILLPLGLMLHLGIIAVHGLVTFSLAMFAALLLYLWPSDLALQLPSTRSEASAPEQQLQAC